MLTENKKPSKNDLVAAGGTVDATLPMTKQEVCSHLKISSRSLEMAVKRGQFPPAVRIGKRAFWTNRTIEMWKARLFKNQEEWVPEQ